MLRLKLGWLLDWGVDRVCFLWGGRGLTMCLGWGLLRPLLRQGMPYRWGLGSRISRRGLVLLRRLGLGLVPCLRGGLSRFCLGLGCRL